MWDTCTSHFGPKEFDRVGRGGSGKVKIGQNIDQNGPRFWLWSPLEAPFEMDSNEPGAVGGIIWGQFQGSSTHLGASRGLQSQKRGLFWAIF